MNERDDGETGARGRRAARVRWRWPAGHWVGVDEWVEEEEEAGEGRQQEENERRRIEERESQWWRRGGGAHVGSSAHDGGAGRARALDSGEGRCGEGRAPGGRVGEREREKERGADDDCLLTLPRLAGKGDGKTKLHSPKGETKG